MQRNSRQVQSLERAMLLLEIIRAEGHVRLTPLAKSAGLGKSTAHALLNTLAELGYIRRDGMDYTLGLRMAALARPMFEKHEKLCRAFTPALRAFADMTGENCFFTVGSGGRSYLTLAAMDGCGNIISLPRDERRDGLLTSAVGKVLLAGDSRLMHQVTRVTPLDDAFVQELAKVTHQGFALDLEASKRDLHCVALPLRIRGKVVAALSAAGPARRLHIPVMHKMAMAAMGSLFDVMKF